MTIKTKKIVLFANWNLGYLTLEKLLNQNIQIECVVTNYCLESDADEFRNKVYYKAKENSIPVYKRYKEIICKLKDNEDYIGISVAYGNEIFKSDVLNLMPIINFHPSMLPEYRGPSPVEWQIKDKKSFIGFTCHIVEEGIDTGSIINQGYFDIDYTWTYENLLDNLNEAFSEFILTNIVSILKTGLENMALKVQPLEHKQYYRPRIGISSSLRKKTLQNISKWINRDRLLFFTGNRAEFGILLPLILECSRDYYIDIIVSGAHVLEDWNTITEINCVVQNYEIPCNIHVVNVKHLEDPYKQSLGEIYIKTLKCIEKQKEYYPYKFAIALGDRIEMMGYALGVFYSQVPLIHIAGGDVANVPYYDTNIRHSISKISNIHFVTNEESRQTLIQMGEEEWRIHNIGNLSYDYDRLNLLYTKKELEEEFDISEQDFLIIFTYHPAPLKNEEENLEDFLICLNAIINAGKHKIIITYPNNDPGSIKILQYLEEYKEVKNIKIVKGLGTNKYLALMKYFRTIIAGNSSSGLLETSYYCIPTLNIGDRQKDRYRGKNVKDIELEYEQVRYWIKYYKEHYEQLKIEFSCYKNIFGDGTAALKVINILKQVSEKKIEELLFKNFIRK